MSSKKIRLGVSGLGGRAVYWIGDLMKEKEIEVVAATDISSEAVARCREGLPQLTYYSSLDKMLQHDIDAVFIATPAFVHGREAIAALNAGKHVISEVTACWTIAEAVELYETATKSGCVYMLSENYCYMMAVQEMRRLYREGAIGELLFADAHYLAMYRDMWVPYCKRLREWRNWMPQSYYSSHALGPVLWITGLRPVEATGFAVPNGRPSRSIGKLSDEVASFVVRLDNGSIVNVTSSFIAPKANHLWWHLSGDEGEMENDRFYDVDHATSLTVVNDKGQRHYTAEPPHSKQIAAGRQHAGGDFFVLYDFIQAVRGRVPASIDVRMSLEMTMPGILAHRSALQGGAKLEVPDLDSPEARDRYRDDTASAFSPAGSDNPVPPSVLGLPELDPSVYDDASAEEIALVQRAFGV